MELQNYKDISSYGASPGFQFEFHCSSCEKPWRSQFKPYRKGQVAGFFGNLMSNFHIGSKAGVATRMASDVGLAGAKKAALEEAQQTANGLYSLCAKCQTPVCGDCFNPRDGICRRCMVQADGRSPAVSAEAASSRSTPAMSCPNCRAPHGGGRFCAECGFDMASTHKSCPECGAMALRQARFCNDCGHGF